MCEDINQSQERIVRKPEVLARTGMSDPTIWRMEKAGEFPKRFKIGGSKHHNCGWLESELVAWMKKVSKERQADQ